MIMVVLAIAFRLHFPSTYTNDHADNGSRGWIDHNRDKKFYLQSGKSDHQAGTTVTWLNQDEAVHQIDSDSKAQVTFVSDSLAHGASFSFTFTQPGTYTYHCTYHPTMKGTIVVQS